VTWARSVPRGAVRPELANGRLTEEVTPEAMVKLVAVPTAVPAALMKDTLPVQDAAVPLVELEATFVRFTRAVSVDPRPNVVRSMVRVFVAEVVCARAHCTTNAEATARILILVITNPLSLYGSMQMSRTPFSTRLVRKTITPIR